MVQQDDLDMWLTAEDLAQEEIVTFADEGRYEDIEIPTGTKRVFNITITLPSGEQRTWTMNKTSRRKISRELGADTVKWIGRQVKLYVAHQKIGEKDIKAIYVREVITEQVAQPEAT